MAKRLKQHHKDRLLVTAGIALLLILLLWWLAARYHWGPYAIKSTTPTTSTVSPAATTGATGANGASGSSGSNGSNATAPPGANTPIFNLYGSVHNGETKVDVGASAGGLDPSCVTLSSTPGSTQQVCTYQNGSKVVTITYLNDNVASVSKSGF